MSVAVRLSDEMFIEARKFAEIHFRSIPKQIEYWCRLGKIAEENQDLPLSFIKGALEGKAEIERGEVSASRSAATSRGSECINFRAWGGLCFWDIISTNPMTLF